MPKKLGMPVDLGQILNLQAETLVIALAAILLAGFVKGTTGVGAPVVGVPILTALFDIAFAVAIFSILNLLSNIWHTITFRDKVPNKSFVLRFAFAGALGAILGSLLLASLPDAPLMLTMAGVVLFYVGFKLTKPNWKLSREAGDRLVIPAGLLGGLLQGAGGLSAPASITFLSALKLPRPEFIGTISAFFCIMSLFQIPTLAVLNILKLEHVFYCGLALLPFGLAIWAGEKVSRFVSGRLFDRSILLLLFAVALLLISRSIA